MRIDTTFNGAGAYNDPSWSGAAGQDTRQRNQYISRVRQDIDIDTRTSTEYGVVRTYFDATFNWTTGTDSLPAVALRLASTTPSSSSQASRW